MSASLWKFIEIMEEHKKIQNAICLDAILFSIQWKLQGCIDTGPKGLTLLFQVPAIKDLHWGSPASCWQIIPWKMRCLNNDTISVILRIIIKLLLCFSLFLHLFLLLLHREYLKNIHGWEEPLIEMFPCVNVKCMLNCILFLLGSSYLLKYNFLKIL